MIDGRRYHGNVKNDLGYFLELEIEKKRANHRNPGIENVNLPLKEDVPIFYLEFQIPLRINRIVL